MLPGCSPHLPVTALTHCARAEATYTASPGSGKAVGSAAAKAKLERNRQRKGGSKASGPQLSRQRPGGSPHQQSGGGRQESPLPCGSGRCWLLPVGRVGRLGAVSGRSCVGSLGGGNRSGAGIVGGCAVPLDGLAIGRGGGRGRVTYNRGQPGQISAETSLRDLSDYFTLACGVPDPGNGTGCAAADRPTAPLRLPPREPRPGKPQPPSALPPPAPKHARRSFLEAAPRSASKDVCLQLT